MKMKRRQPKSKVKQSYFVKKIIVRNCKIPQLFF